MAADVSGAGLDGFESADVQQRARACRRAAKDPAGALLAERLVEALGDPERAVSRAAAHAIVTLERGGARIEPLLRRALRGGDARRRVAAALVLARLGAAEIGLLPALVEALASASGDVRWAGTRALAELGRLHAEVLPLLLGLVGGDERSSVRRMAALALGELAGERPESIAALLRATRDGDAAVRAAAVSALSGLSEPSAEIAERLSELVTGDPDPRVQRLGCAALAQVGHTLPGPCRTALERARDSGHDPALRRAARYALEQWRARRERG